MLVYCRITSFRKDFEKTMVFFTERTIFLKQILKNYRFFLLNENFTEQTILLNEDLTYRTILQNDHSVRKRTKSMENKR